ncbi:helix-turn-helix transcriptional regulator [Ketogulonicigenium vulgare]|uniref:helix-turn-helix transcriptional regulator n=1 Tax=Ketogulonicigenium vulgare TaxID=92945 RepID=UPI00235968D7|nr:helix-turn-helix domain-containing protein [Ketogulonicigenium vulgare]
MHNLLTPTYNPDKLITRDQVQEKFGLSRRYLEIAAVRGDGPPMIKLGRSVRYRTGDIRDWIEAHKVHSTKDQRSK